MALHWFWKMNWDERKSIELHPSGYTEVHGGVDTVERSGRRGRPKAMNITDPEMRPGAQFNRDLGFRLWFREKLRNNFSSTRKQV